MSGSRQDQIYVEFERRIQAFEQALDGVIQSAIQKNILTQVQQKTIIDVNKNCALYPETNIPNHSALSFALQAWNTLSIIKAFLNFLKVAGPSVFQLQTRNTEVYNAGTGLVDSIKIKINEIKDQPLAGHEIDIKKLVSAGRSFLNFFYDAATEKCINENIDSIINNVINSPAIQALWTKGTVVGQINGQRQKNLPPFIKEIAGILNELSQLKVEENNDREDEVAIQMDEMNGSFEEEQVEEMSLDKRLDLIKDRYQHLKENVEKNNPNTFSLIRHTEQLRDDLNSLIVNAETFIANHYDTELEALNDEKDRLEAEVKRKTDENDEINARINEIVQDKHFTGFFEFCKALEEFVSNYEQIVLSYTNSWTGMALNFDVSLSNELNTKCSLDKLASLLGKELPWKAWDWKSETKNKYVEFFAVEKKSMHDKHAALLIELKEATPRLTLKKDIDAIKEQLALVGGQIKLKTDEQEKFKTGMKEVKESYLVLSEAISRASEKVQERYKKYKSAKDRLANYLEKRHETFKILDFFEGIIESISKLFGGDYKSQQTKRREYVGEVCTKIDDLENHPGNANKSKALATAISNGIAMFKPGVDSESPKYKETFTLKGSLEEINKELGQAALL